MSAKLLFGKPVQEALLEEVAAAPRTIVAAGERPPHLTAVLVGDDPASAIYVRTKTNKCREVGFGSEGIVLPGATTTEELLSTIRRLNADDNVDGILVQLPLPKHCDTKTVLDAVDPAKDVDCFHPLNTGLLVQGPRDARRNHRTARAQRYPDRRQTCGDHRTQRHRWKAHGDATPAPARDRDHLPLPYT